MTAIEVCPICDIAGCVHIRARQAAYDPSRPGYGSTLPPTNTAPSDLAKLLSMKQPAPWRCPGCGCWQAPTTAKCECGRE